MDESSTDDGGLAYSIASSNGDYMSAPDVKYFMHSIFADDQDEGRRAPPSPHLAGGDASGLFSMGHIPRSTTAAGITAGIATDLNNTHHCRCSVSQELPSSHCLSLGRS